LGRLVWGFVDAELAKLDEHDEMVKKRPITRAPRLRPPCRASLALTVVRRLSRLKPGADHVDPNAPPADPAAVPSAQPGADSSSRSTPAPAAGSLRPLPAQRVPRPSRSPQPF